MTDSPSADPHIATATRRAAGWGLAWYAAEAVQSIGLIPFYAAVLGPGAAAGWLAIVASAGLVAMACAGHYQPLIRNIAAARSANAPANWHDLLRRSAFLGAVSLLSMQALFAIGLFGFGTSSASISMLACLLYFAALHFRLAAYNRFALLNGLRQVGRDKALLLTASLATSALLLVLGGVLRSAWALGAAVMIGSAWLYALSVRTTRGLDSTGPVAQMPGRREMAGLLLLAAAGYLNTGTDIVIATRLLPSAVAIDYAFWSRILFVQVAVVGLWTQLRFPYWSDPSLPPSLLRRPAARAIGWLVLAGGMLWLVTAAWPWPQAHRGLPWATLLAMSLNAFAACVTVMLGQMMTARSAYRFVRPSIAAGCMAPLAAWFASSLGGGSAFVWGYLTINLILTAINLACFVSVTRTLHTPRP